MHPSFGRSARKILSALLCAAAVIAAGCHHNNQNSGYGIAWVTLSDTPGDFTSYIVNVDSVTLTGAAYGVITAVATPETVDFTKLDNIAELWSAASIPNDTYTAATIALDYTNANISVMVNGVPQKAKVVDPTGAAVTTQTINVTLDPAHPVDHRADLSSSSAMRLAIDFNLAASNVVNLTKSPADRDGQAVHDRGRGAGRHEAGPRARPADQFERRPRHLHGVRAAVLRRSEQSWER